MARHNSVKLPLWYFIFYKTITVFFLGDFLNFGHKKNSTKLWESPRKNTVGKFSGITTTHNQKKTKHNKNNDYGIYRKSVNNKYRIGIFTELCLTST
jgi:hypothetical protein